ncbi:hypothetical protein K435DRAFT_933087 [Dendrothele bispora CBS 962.96]|uniref:Uncharacterized protein n=1 Tax=Dendrothele bispora (strain CBS 962.96) TaxID=1314807 RepID=A0A4S8MD77_DENBC|nr:hypothetical protein K435DRAFT_933087 [Dendrothele bispora CBS 962.96]
MSNSPSNWDQVEIEIFEYLLHMIGQLGALIAVVFMIYGIYLAVTLLAMQVLISQGIRNFRLVFFGIIVFELLISTTYAILILVFITFIFFSLDPNSKRLQHWLVLSTQVGIGIDFVIRLNFLISDGLAVWRIWVLFPFNKLVRVALVFCMLVTTVCTFVDAGLNARSALRDIDVRDPASQTLLTALPILITNVVATSLVGYKTWLYRQDVKRNLMSRISVVSKTLWLLIISGLIYCIIWIAFIIVTQTGPSPNDATASLSALVFTGITPLLATPSLPTPTTSPDFYSTRLDSPQEPHDKTALVLLASILPVPGLPASVLPVPVLPAPFTASTPTPRSEIFFEVDLRN